MNQTAYDYVDEQSILSSLICPICLEILEDPHIHIGCDSAFCRSCLLQLVEPFCPICRWSWNHSVPLDYNIYLPKAGRLIRNMLDDLRVKCVHCQTIRRRSEFSHPCNPKNRFNESSSHSSSPTTYFNRNSSYVFIICFIVWLFMLYIYQADLFLPLSGVSMTRIQPIAINIDTLIIGKFFSLIGMILSHPILALIFHGSVWFVLKFFGERYMPAKCRRILQEIFELLIIGNLIIYSYFN